jgi:hypothetical protein
MSVASHTIVAVTNSRLKQRHHTAPRVYLRGFADADEMLAVRRRAGNEFAQHVDNVTVRNGFYNVRNSDGRLHDAVENWFMTDIENPVGPVLGALRTSGAAGPVVGDDITMIGNFVAAQLYRTATARAYLDQIDGYIGPLIAVDKITGDLGIDVWRLTPRQRAQHMRAAASMLRRHQAPDEIRVSQVRTTLREIDKTMVRLGSWHWEVLEAAEACLITSDAPAVGLRPDPGVFNGMIPSWSPVFLPLSPKRLLMGSPRATGVRGRLGLALASIVNRRVSYEAADAIINAPGQAWPQRLSLSPRPPQLPPPMISINRTPGGGRPTFPTRHPPVSSPSIRALLDTLGADDVVE